MIRQIGSNLLQPDLVIVILGVLAILWFILLIKKGQGTAWLIGVNKSKFLPAL